MPISIAIVDDHNLVAITLAEYIGKFDQYKVILTAENGRDLLNQLQFTGLIPDIALVDVNMPIMDGFETAARLREHYPTVRVLALSMNDKEEYIVRMIRNGARGYLLKESRPSELRRALDDIMTKEYYTSDYLTMQLIRGINGSSNPNPGSYFNLSDREYDFLKMACSDLTYTEIADKMCVSPRTIDGYRENVFQKLNVRTRTSMVIEAIRHGLITL